VERPPWNGAKRYKYKKMHAMPFDPGAEKASGKNDIDREKYGENRLRDRPASPVFTFNKS
jgi:hypothetical protein